MSVPFPGIQPLSIVPFHKSDGELSKNMSFSCWFRRISEQIESIKVEGELFLSAGRLVADQMYIPTQ